MANLVFWLSVERLCEGCHLHIYICCMMAHDHTQGVAPCILVGGESVGLQKAKILANYGIMGIFFFGGQQKGWLGGVTCNQICRVGY